MVLLKMLKLKLLLVLDAVKEIEMKYRNGFVSNSSSSSFIIGKAHMTERQIKSLSKLVLVFNDDEEHYDSYITESEYYFVGNVEYRDVEDLRTIVSKSRISKKFIHSENE